MHTQISIIIPVYNAQHTIKRCIDSVLSQDMQAFELVIVNDGSTDTTGQICEQYKVQHSNIQVFHTENRGVSAARNCGVQHATGEYVVFMDSDDYAMPNMCSKLLEERERSQADIIIANHAILGVRRKKRKNIAMLQWRDHADDMIHLYTSGVLAPPFAKLFLRSKIGSFNEDISLGEDLLFILQYLENESSVSYIDTIIYHKEHTENSLSRCYKETLFEDNVFLYQNLVRVFDKNFHHGYNKDKVLADVSVKFRLNVVLLVRSFSDDPQKIRQILSKWLSSPILQKSLSTRPRDFKSWIFNIFAKTGNISLITCIVKCYIPFSKK